MAVRWVSRAMAVAIVAAGMGVLGAMLEEERAKLCGARYVHQPERKASRAATPTANSRSAVDACVFGARAFGAPTTKR